MNAMKSFKLDVLKIKEIKEKKSCKYWVWPGIHGCQLKKLKCCFFCLEYKKEYRKCE